MRLPSLLVFVGFIACQQQPDNTTPVASTNTDQQTPSSFSTPVTTTTEQTRTERLPVKKTSGERTSSYTPPAEIPLVQADPPPASFDHASFNRSVQQFITGSRSEMLQAERPEVFILQPQQLATIKTSKGTLINIHTSDLETIDGSPVTGPVKFIVKEMMTIGDMLKMHAPTVSNGEILETGGSWHISATAEGKQLKLKEGKEYTISTPLPQDTGDAYDVYYGSVSGNGTVNWQVTPSVFTRNTSTVRFTPNFNYTIRRVILDKYSYSMDGLMTQEPYNETGDFVEQYIEVGNLYYEAQKLRKAKNKGRFAIYRSAPELKQQGLIKQYVNTGVISILATYEGGYKYIFTPKNGSNDYKLVIDTAALRAESEWLRPDIKKLVHERIAGYIRQAEKEFQARLTNVEKQRKLEQEMAVTARLDRFGWINCDRLYKYDGDRMNYSVYAKAEMPADAVVVYMVFKKIRSILNSNVNGNGDLVFSNVPDGAEVKLVAVGKSGTDILYGQTEYYRLRKGQPFSLHLQKVTHDEMAARMSALQ